MRGWPAEGWSVTGRARAWCDRSGGCLFADGPVMDDETGDTETGQSRRACLGYYDHDPTGMWKYVVKLNREDTRSVYPCVCPYVCP